MGGYIAATRHASISRGWNILKIRRSIKISFSLFFFFFFSNETFLCGNSGKEEEGFTSINVVIVSV